jgi:hypothetical protein
MMRKRLSQRALILGATALAVAVSGGVAYATIPASTGVINGCYEKRTGILRVIDAEASKTCMSFETPISWNQRGLKGDQGLQGLQGQKGEKGDKGDPGTPAPLYTAGQGLELSDTEFRLAFDPAQVAQLQQQVAELQQGYDDLRAKQQAQAANLVKLENQFISLTRSLESQIKGLEDVLISGLGDTRAQILSLQSLIDDVKARVDALKAWACSVDPKGPC